MNNVYTFPNGLKIVCVEVSAFRSVSISYTVGVGSAYESKRLNGISHLIEHMLFKGTQKRTSFDIVRETDDIGADMNAQTSTTSTRYYTLSVAAQAEKCMDILSDLFFNATFPVDELEKEKSVVIEEIAEDEDSPADVCYDNMKSVLFAKNTLSRTILGTESGVRALTVDDIRAYRAKFYTPQNTVITFVGAITMEQAIALTEKYAVNEFQKLEFGVLAEDADLPNAAAEDVLYQGSNDLDLNAFSSGFICREKSIEQAHLSFGFPSYGYFSDMRFAVRVLSNIFGDSMSSRLFQRVREELGLCYSISGSSYMVRNVGLFEISTSVKVDNVAKTVLAIREEILKLLENGITDAELERGKAQTTASHVLAQESGRALMVANGNSVLIRGVAFDIDYAIEMIQKVTKEDVMKCAREVFNFDYMAASIVAPKCKTDVFKLMTKGKTASK